jgi:branched-chain amino acid transport system substrate-binding protein
MLSRRRLHRTLAVVSLVALTGAGCGSGLSHEEIVRAASYHDAPGNAAPPPSAQPGSSAPGPATAESGSAGTVEATAGPATTATGPSGSTGGVRVIGRSVGSAGSASAAGAATPAANSPGQAIPGAPTSSAGTGGSTGLNPGAGGPAAPATCAADCKALVLGSVGTYSGIVGQNVTPGVKAVQAWVAATNAAGGLGGHRVEFVVADDGSDPARHRALVQELVENKGVVAFVYNAAPLSGQASVDYVTSKRVPIIGSEIASEWFYASPMFFPQATSGKMVHAADLAADARALLPDGKKRLGLIFCSDGVQICKDAAEVIPGYARKVGFDFVYQGSGSLAQPDFTAECLAARNAGVQVLVPIMDANSAQRIGRSCASVGFKPTYSLGPPILFEHFQEDPNFEGSIGTPVVAPWLDTANPGIAEFRAAMKRYAPDVPASASAPLGWVSAKLLERAARNLPAQPTSAAVLEGLWSVHDDTLGGLTFPLSFVRDRVAERPLCAGVVIVQDGKWRIHPKGQLTCATN